LRPTPGEEKEMNRLEISQNRYLTVSRKGACLLAFIPLFLGLCGIVAAQPVDPDATQETVTLLRSLDASRGKVILFGHQETTLYGIGWTAAGTGDSDVKRTTGTFPAVYGWDLFEPRETTLGRDAGSLHEHVMAAHARGGMNTFSWHYSNPVAGGNFYDTTKAVPAILPGGEKHAAFLADLDFIAAFFQGLRDTSGRLIPVIFRPWHEHNGKWFWWGTPHHCTEDEFRTLWRFTVDYLRNEKKVHNVLYAWSPNWSRRDEYFTGYPGDEYVDVFGLDAYVPSLKGVVPLIRQVVEWAEKRGKIPALTETGYPDGLSKCKRQHPFTEGILAPLKGDPVASRLAWMLFWRNAGEDHFWVPPPEHPFAEDFRRFQQDPLIAFGDVRVTGPPDKTNP